MTFVVLLLTNQTDMTTKPIIYQMLPRLWGNNKVRPKKNGSLEENGTGKFKDIDRPSLEYFKWLGCSHVWYTGIIRHSTQESSSGCIPSHPQFVKGKAGSPYAICDYYDVNPYLADNPEERMKEFIDLVERTHDAGLKVIIDFVPNHVSRDYGKVGIVEGHPVLGAEDDVTVIGRWRTTSIIIREKDSGFPMQRQRAVKIIRNVQQRLQATTALLLLPASTTGMRQ